MPSTILILFARVDPSPSEFFSPQPIVRIAKAITSKCFIVVLAEFLEVLESFIDVCDDDEINFRETLQSEKDFITKRIRLNPSCVLESGFVSLEVAYFEVGAETPSFVIVSSNPPKLLVKILVPLCKNSCG